MLNYLYRESGNKMKKRTKNFLYLLVISILVCIYLISFIGRMFESNEGFENESTFPSLEIANKIKLYIYPVLFFYIGSVIYFLKKGITLRKILFPIITITFYLLWRFLGITYEGPAFGWVVIFLLMPLIVFLIGIFILGIWMDNREIKKNNLKVIK